MLNITQEEFVINHLKENGFISRNYCLDRFISRLGAIMYKLRKDGYDFESETVNGDYVYKLKGVSNQLYYNNLTTSLKSLNKDQTRVELDKQLNKILLNLQVGWQSNDKIMEVKTSLKGTHNEIKLACVKKYQDYIKKA